jgi:hypothetical protein
VIVDFQALMDNCRFSSFGGFLSATTVDFFSLVDYCRCSQLCVLLAIFRF